VPAWRCVYLRVVVLRLSCIGFSCLDVSLGFSGTASLAPLPLLCIARSDHLARALQALPLFLCLRSSASLAMAPLLCLSCSASLAPLALPFLRCLSCFASLALLPVSLPILPCLPCFALIVVPLLCCLSSFGAVALPFGRPLLLCLPWTESVGQAQGLDEFARLWEILGKLSRLAKAVTEAPRSPHRWNGPCANLNQLVISDDSWAFH
jgi:hypothetical protein